jgi:metal-responsive CopG/Arc/MetJ family transcriptional regulator
MRHALSVSLPEKLSIEIDQILKEDGISRSDFFRQAISDHIYFKKFKKIRDKMILKARSNGIFTDEDVFERVS